MSRSMHIHATNGRLFCEMEGYIRTRTKTIFFYFNRSGFILKKMKITLLQKSDGIRECPIPCENVFELP